MADCRPSHTRCVFICANCRTKKIFILLIRHEYFYTECKKSHLLSVRYRLFFALKNKRIIQSRWLWRQVSPATTTSASTADELSLGTKSSLAVCLHLWSTSVSSTNILKYVWNCPYLLCRSRCTQNFCSVQSKFFVFPCLRHKFLSQLLWRVLIWTFHFRTFSIFIYSTCVCCLKALNMTVYNMSVLI